MVRVQARRAAGAFACMLLAAAAQAQSDSQAHSAYVVASATADEDDNSNTHIEFGLPLGRSAWVFAGAGQEESNSTHEDLDADVLSAGFGIGIAQVELTTAYVQRKDGAFEQGDWSFALDWHGEQGGIGVDVFMRSADAETVASIERRRREPLSVRILESLDARGYGIHGDVDVTAALNLFATAMTYDYDDIDTNHPLLSQLLYSSGSGVTRDQAFLDQSLGCGATYRFTTVSVTLQYVRDEALETHDITDTAALSLIVLLGAHWSLAPGIGYSSNDANGGLAYGGVTLGYNW